jgi:hypothetical protein
MEVSSGPATNLPPLTTSPSAGAKQSPRKTPTSSPKRAAKDSRLRSATVTSGKESTTTRSRAKSTRLAPGVGKPIVPVTERRAHDPDKSPLRSRNESAEQKWELTPDGSSAGREGRQFAVANVGNNGRIYLR